MLHRRKIIRPTTLLLKRSIQHSGYGVHFGNAASILFHNRIVFSQHGVVQ